MSLNLKALIGKLNGATRNGLEAAAGMCVSLTHYDIEVEHYLTKMLDAADSDVAAILKHFSVDSSRFSKELSRSLEKLKRGNARSPAISPTTQRMLTEAWMIGSIDFGARRIRSGFTILALASDTELARFMREISQEFQLIEPARLHQDFDELEFLVQPSGFDELEFQLIEPARLHQDFANIVSGSREEAPAAERSPAELGGAPATGGPTPNLDQYTINLTENARRGKIDPVLGRDFEIRQIVDILTRRRQNNPILTGEAGVGKTAVVEGFALRLARGDVPPPLRNVTLRSLDLGLLQAGAGVKGEFENRLKSLIEEVKSSAAPIILFIDEAHTMIGAGGQAGQNDAANLLKPALARGELRTIAATTWSEYKKYFEKDPALARRFQLVKVEE